MTQANPSSGRWNYGREIAENFAESGEHNSIYHIYLLFFLITITTGNKEDKEITFISLNWNELQVNLLFFSSILNSQCSQLIK